MSLNTQLAADDRQILRQIAAGDRQALAELYERYHHILFGYLRQLTPDYGLAEELLQDTHIDTHCHAVPYRVSDRLQLCALGHYIRHTCHFPWRRHLGSHAAMAWTDATPVINQFDDLVSDWISFRNSNHPSYRGPTNRPNISRKRTSYTAACSPRCLADESYHPAACIMLLYVCRILRAATTQVIKLIREGISC